MHAPHAGHPNPAIPSPFFYRALTFFIGGGNAFIATSGSPFPGEYFFVKMNQTQLGVGLRPRSAPSHFVCKVRVLLLGNEYT